jgi:hypothetical protein
MRTRLSLIALSLVAALAVPSAAQASDCGKDVETAFEKLRTSPSYRVLAKQPSPRGEIDNTTDYQAPDKMYQKVVVPGEPGALETIAIGRWAWANQGGGWQELQPQFAQSVTFHVSETLGRPTKSGGSFTCLGKVAWNGRDVVGYRSEPTASADRPEGPDNPKLARTVYVDPASGLPAYNFVAEPKPEAQPLFSATYVYPGDIKIEAPAAVPAGRTR